jgi:hypothetical protein
LVAVDPSAALIGPQPGKQRWGRGRDRRDGAPSMVHNTTTLGRIASPGGLCTKSVLNTTGLGSGAGVDALCTIPVALSTHSRHQPATSRHIPGTSIRVSAQTPPRRPIWAIKQAKAPAGAQRTAPPTRAGRRHSCPAGQRIESPSPDIGATPAPPLPGRRSWRPRPSSSGRCLASTGPRRAVRPRRRSGGGSRRAPSPTPPARAATPARRR